MIHHFWSIVQEKMHAAIGEEVDPEIPDDEKIAEAIAAADEQVKATMQQVVE